MREETYPFRSGLELHDFRPNHSSMAVLRNPPSSLPPEDQIPAGMMRCPVCKKAIAHGARTCPHCGKSFTTVGGIFWAVLLGLLLGGWFLVRNR